VIAFATALAVVGCSGSEAGSEPSASPTAASDSAVGTVETATTPSTVPSTTATTEPATTTVTYEEVETAVRAAHTRFMTELFTRDERVDGQGAWLPLVELLTTGPQLARMREGTATRVENGEFVAGRGYDSNIVDVVIEDDRASVVDCSEDRGTRYSADGELIGGESGFYRFRETLLVKIDHRWLVEDFIVGGEQPCDPSDYS
jgi:hypothetical protein